MYCGICGLIIKRNIKEKKMRCMKQFEEIKNGFTIDDKLIKLEDLVNNINTDFVDSEWGFPKGKRKAHENNEECASREFCEETNFDLAEFDIH